MTFAQLKKEFDKKGYELSYRKKVYYFKKHNTTTEHECTTRASIETQLEWLTQEEEEEKELFSQNY